VGAARDGVGIAEPGTTRAFAGASLAAPSWAMAWSARRTEDPERVLAEAASFLASDPIRHSVVSTTLHRRIGHPEPGRYWIADHDGTVVGVALQSPLHFMATVTPMPAEAAASVVDAIVEEGVRLPGVNGEAATAARFAGHWTERAKTAARPDQGQRIYEVETVTPARPTSGRLRQAGSNDEDRMVGWFEEFESETAAPSAGDTAATGPRTSLSSTAEVVARRLGQGQLWVWDDGGPVAMAGLSEPVSGAARVGPVYTPPDRRNAGYGSALVAAVSSGALANGQRCMLYTDLSNPTSNSIYRAIGYRALAEALRYRFDD
jgi:predicted GNAT family acetyltransferase